MDIECWDCRRPMAAGSTACPSCGAHPKRAVTREPDPDAWRERWIWWLVGGGIALVVALRLIGNQVRDEEARQLVEAQLEQQHRDGLRADRINQACGQMAANQSLNPKITSQVCDQLRAGQR